MNPQCQRWVELADLEALGEALPSEAVAFRRAHEATCADCAREAALWRATVVQPHDEALDEVEVENIVALAAAARVRHVAAARRWKGAFFAIGAAACAAAATLAWFSGRSTQQSVTQGGAQALRTAPGASALSNQAHTQTGVVAAESAESSAEPHCLDVVAGATVCLGRGAALGRRALTGSERELEVTRGHVVVSLAPQPAGTSFSLSTSSGKVTAVGTIFSVEVRADGSTVARVVEGKVMTRAASEGTAQPLQAGRALRLGEQQPRLLAAGEREADLALLSLSEADQPGVAGPSSSAREARPGADHAAPRDMLDHARSLRASGNFRGAVEVYRKIHAANPASPSGRAALVSLGELLLTLHDARGALNAFDTYLAGGGALAQEAGFGRARALRALNRPAEERRAIERFLAAHPEAPQSRVLRARLAAMPK
jgi:hypothetical protein